MTVLRSIARRLGFDLVPLRKPRDPHDQLVRILDRLDVGCVLDVGANVGQYAMRLRRHGWRGAIVSFEPLPAVHDTLTRAAASDVAWRVAPAMALGEKAGEVTIDVSAECDMSSLLPQNELLSEISPSSAVVDRMTVPLRRLDEVAGDLSPDDDRLFLKIDVQGYEPQVMAGASGIWQNIVGVQLEMALVPCYEGEQTWLQMIDLMAARGFVPWLILPGYFEPRLARQLQIDAVFARDLA